MFGSDWGRNDQIKIGIAAAFILTTLLVFTWMLASLDASYSQQAEYAAAQYADRTQARISGTCQDREPNAFAKCVQEIVESTHEAQTSERDLGAQQRMALWALATFCSSVASVLVTIVGIFFVWRTLEANQAAVETANRAIDSERETGEAQVRAYLSLDNVEVEIGDPSTRPATIRFDLINSGNSPALRTEVWFAVSDKGMVGKNTLTPVTGVQVGTVRQSPSSQRESGQIHNPIFEGSALPGNAQIFIRVFVSFEDVFDKDQLEEFDFGAVVRVIDYPKIIPLRDWSSGDFPRMLMLDVDERVRRKRERRQTKS